MYYRTYEEISLSAIGHNADALTQRLGGVKIMAIVKADAYGCGADEIGPLLDKKVAYFGVAAIEEAVALRKSGVTKPILVLAYSSPEQYGELLDYNITQTIYDLENARLLSDAALSRGKKATVHIAVDTGMSRLGFIADKKSVPLIKEICTLPGLYTEGFFSHLARADEDNTSYSDNQVKRFENLVAALEEAGVRIPIKHICNSAGSLNVPEKFNMVRVGILLYGLYPDEKLKKYGLNLHLAMKIISHVVDVREIDAGVGVSYGHAFVSEKPMRLATVCIGYADGYPRALSDKGRVIVGGRYAKVVGRVCMDLMMVDITDIPNVKIGDSVTIMGQDGALYVSAEELAQLSGTINYEIICSFKNRVKRVYKP